MKKRLLLVPLAGALAIAAAGTGGASPQSPEAAGSALIRCGKTRSIGLLAPITGPAASLGAPIVRWVEYYVRQYNRTHRNRKFRLVRGDTRLGTSVAEAVRAAQFVRGNASVLGVVGPAGSQEVEATTATMVRANLGYVSGSATRTSLTLNRARKGFFFRTVPPDAQQGADAATFINSRLRARRVWIIDDQSSYSAGLADVVERRLRAAGGITVTRESVSQQQSDFSALIARIPRNTQLVYVPWQLPPRGQAFGRQMRAAGRGNITLMGGDGLYDPAFAGVGTNVYVTMFPVNPSAGVIASYRRSHGGRGDFFGAPHYPAAQVVGGAIDRACANGTATRAEVRRQILRTNIRTSLLGLPIRFDRNGDIRRKRFGVWKSSGSDFAPFA